MDNIEIKTYQNESQLPRIMELIGKDLSEPYSIFTYRYFLHNWPKLCLLAHKQNEIIGVIVCKVDMKRNETVKRGYIGMIAVDDNCRRQGIGKKLVVAAIQAMKDEGCQEVALEAETKNKSALQLYENLGFIRDKRLENYYLSGDDAFRLKSILT